MFSEKPIERSINGFTIKVAKVSLPCEPVISEHLNNGIEYSIVRESDGKICRHATVHSDDSLMRFFINLESSLYNAIVKKESWIED